MGYSKSPKWALHSATVDDLFGCYYNLWLRQLSVKPAEPLVFKKNNGALNSAMGYFESPKWALNSGKGDYLLNCYFNVCLRQLNVNLPEPLVFFLKLRSIKFSNGLFREP